MFKTSVRTSIRLQLAIIFTSLLVISETLNALNEAAKLLSGLQKISVKIRMLHLAILCTETDTFHQEDHLIPGQT